MTREGYAARSIFQNANRSFMMTPDFKEFDLQPPLVQTIADIDYAAPTPIQSAVIPAMLAGQDVIGQSRTGSGKTAAFSLPILHNLQTGQRHVQSLVVTPTRERAIVALLLGDGHDLAEVAAVALKLARAEEKQRPMAPLEEVAEFSAPVTGQALKRPDRPVDS
jgi:hypothetical protein